MKRNMFLFFGLLSAFSAQAQLVVGGVEPPPSRRVAVEIRSSGKGVLLPRLSRSERLAMAVDSSAAGLVVYQHDGNRGLYAWDGTSWVGLAPLRGVSDSGLDLRDFARVAYTGRYEDLRNRPAALDSLRGGGESFARVAYTGRYEDLTGRPDIPSSLPALATVAYTGRYEDLANKPELPSRVSDMEEDAYYMAVSLEEREAWDAHASVPVPLRLGDLEQDEFAQLVSDADIFRWDSSARRAIPARLRELEPDSLHRTVTQGQKSVWEEASARVIPSRVSDLEEDYAHRLVSEEQAAAWDAMVGAVGFSGNYEDLEGKPDIPLSLAEVYGDDFYQTVSEADIRRWDAMTGRRYRTYLTELTADSGHRVATQEEVDRWEAAARRDMPVLSAASVSGSYADIPSEYRYKPYSEALAATGRFEYINNQAQDYPVWAPVAVTGRYEDLTGRPDVLYEGKEALRYQDLVDTPAYRRVAVTGYFGDLADAAALKRLESYLGDGTSEPVSRSLSDSLEEMRAVLSRPPGPGSDFAGEDYRSLRLKEDVVLPAGTRVETASYRPEDPRALATYALVNAYDGATAAAVRAARDRVPEGSVIFWTDVDGTGFPDCWRPLDGIPGRFPVGVGGEVSEAGAKGGEETHLLEGKEMPAHYHRIGDGDVHHFDVSSGAVYYPFDADDSANPMNADANRPISPSGGGQAHENRPPYRAVYVLVKDQDACRSRSN